MFGRILFAALLCSIPAISAADSTAPEYRIDSQIAGADGSFDYANVDPITNRVYVARGDAVTIVDLATGTSRQLVAANRAHQVLLIKNGAELLQTDGGSNLARFIDTKSGSVLAEVATGKKPDAALLDPATGLIAVMNGGDGTVTLIDPVKHVLVGSVTVGGTLEFAVADGKGKIWVNVEDSNQLVSVDLKARKVVDRVALTGCDEPSGLAWVAKGTRLISSCANGVATVTDPKTRKVVATLAIGQGPDAVLYDAARGLAFIPCGGSGTLEIISAANAANIRVVGHVATRTSAKTGALDQRTGKIYLPSAKLLPPEPGAKRGKPEPGSFAVLVIAPTIPTPGSMK